MRKTFFSAVLCASAFCGANAFALEESPSAQSFAAAGMRVVPFGMEGLPAARGSEHFRSSRRTIHQRIAAAPRERHLREGRSMSGGGTVSASFYGGGPKKYEPNTHTANGERFNQWGMTAAHRSLPFGTKLRVSYAGRSIVVRVNDRGPAAWTGRSLDLSRGAAHALGMGGTAHVQVAVLN